jgi:hypothetical protein
MLPKHLEHPGFRSTVTEFASCDVIPRAVEPWTSFSRPPHYACSAEVRIDLEEETPLLLSTKTSAVIFYICLKAPFQSYTEDCKNCMKNLSASFSFETLASLFLLEALGIYN